MLGIDSAEGQRQDLLHDRDTLLLLVHGRLAQHQLSEEDQALSDGGVRQEDL